MAEISDFERRANQYITEHVAKGGKRDDVLADWARSENPELQKYAKGIFAKDLNPDQAAAEATGNNNPPGNENTGMASYLKMAADMAPIVAPVAAGSAGLAYYYGKKKGQGVAPPLSDFESKKQQLELERMQLQNDVERARLNQMAAKGQPLDTQAKFSEPTAIEVAADTTSVREPSPATVAVDKVQKAAQLAEANRQLGIGGNQPVDPGPIVRGQLPGNNPLFSSSPKAPNPAIPPQFSPAGIPAGDIPPAPPYQPATPFSAAPPGAPAPESSAGPNSSTTSIVNNTVKEMIDEVDKPPQELRTGTGKPAFAGMGPAAALNKKGEPKFKPDYADINQVPKDYAFVPGAQYIDPARQDMGQTPFTETFKSRDYPLTDEMARQQAAEVNRMLNKPTRAELKAAGLELAPNTPGITKRTSAGTKPVRVAGTMGALIAISDLAKAETAGQRGMAGANLLEAVLPPGFMMGGAGQGSGTVPSFDQAVLLGSPYAQTEFAKKKRQEQEYTRKINRAVPPPMR
jgi:hypothetical protein